MDKPVKGKVSAGLLLIGAGLLYYVWIRVTGLMIPCPFRLLTGIRCPGCGVTTMIMAAGRGDLHSALEANPFLFVTSPFLIALLIHRLRLRTGGRQETDGWRIGEKVYLAALLLFGIVRGVQDFLLLTAMR